MTWTCPQCLRRVRVDRRGKRGRCKDCETANDALRVYWRDQGMPLHTYRPAAVYIRQVPEEAV